jgi:HEPN domain-containing protein
MPEITRLSLARDWLAKATEDLELARAAGTLRPPRYGGGLFHCQQAAEKALKGFLFFRSAAFEKTHDLRELLILCRKLEAAFDALRNDAALLTPFALAYRYPTDLTEPNEQEFQAALAAAERVYRFVLSRHPELHPEPA